MKTEQTQNVTLASASYVALRHGGAPPDLARVQLGLCRRVAFELEQCFRRRKGGVARDERHVRAVLKAGGFPVCRASGR